MWQIEALSIEIKRRAVYVYDFWLKVLAPPFIQVLVSYFLWDAVFTQSGQSEIGGYTFSTMMLYTVIAASVYQMVQPDIGIVLMDIYEGTLTKYLFYPLSFFQFKFLAHAAHMLLVSVQFLLGIGLYCIIFGFDPLARVSLWAITGGALAVFLAGVLFFLFTAAIEVIGFWVETVWGLVLMLQFSTNLLGGKLIPLSVFPSWAGSALQYTPFPYMVSFPTRVFMGEVGAPEYIVGTLVSLIWCVLLGLLARAIWNRGSYNYSGTGM